MLNVKRGLEEDGLNSFVLQDKRQKDNRGQPHSGSGGATPPNHHLFVSVATHRRNSVCMQVGNSRKGGARDQ